MTLKIQRGRQFAAGDASVAVFDDKGKAGSWLQKASDKLVAQNLTITLKSGRKGLTLASASDWKAFMAANCATREQTGAAFTKKFGITYDQASPFIAGLMRNVAACPVDHTRARHGTPRTKADEFVWKLLRIKEHPDGATSASAYSLFQKSMLISATRCTLTYVLFPIVFPLIGIAKERKLNPRQLATDVVAKLDVAGLCEPVEIAGPGFLNFRLKPAAVAANRRNHTPAPTPPGSG